MRMGTVSLSDLVRENRMDAGYHLAAKEHEARVAALRLRLSDDEARAVVADMPDAVVMARTEGRLVLSPLLRGNMSRTALRDLRAIADEYPHLSIAMLAPHLAPAADQARRAVDDMERSIARMEEISRIAEPEKKS